MAIWMDITTDDRASTHLGSMLVEAEDGTTVLPNCSNGLHLNPASVGWRIWRDVDRQLPMEVMSAEILVGKLSQLPPGLQVNCRLRVDGATVGRMALQSMPRTEPTDS